MRLGPLLAAAPALLLAAAVSTATASAGSITGESVWDRNNARQRALEQVPRGAAVQRTRCEDLTVGRGNTRYRCTVFYADPPPRPVSGPGPQSGPQPDPADSRP